MIRVYDYACKHGHVTELFVDGDATEQTCPVCHEMATRQLSAPRAQLDGASGDFPTAADQWERRRESHMRKERKNQEKHGSYE